VTGHRWRTGHAHDVMTDDPAKPPSWLTPGARAEWDRLADQLTGLGLLTAMDQAAFAVYCQAYDDFIESVESMKGEKSIIVSGNGTAYRNPKLCTRHESFNRLLKAAAVFGLTPADRAAVKVVKSEKSKSVKTFAKGKPKLKLPRLAKSG